MWSKIRSLLPFGSANQLHAGIGDLEGQAQPQEPCCTAQPALPQYVGHAWRKGQQSAWAGRDTRSGEAAAAALRGDQAAAARSKPVLLHLDDDHKEDTGCDAAQTAPDQRATPPPAEMACAVWRTPPRAAPKPPSAASPLSFTPAVEVAYGELLLGQQLGRGAFGIVYASLWRGTQVAVKLVSCGPQQHPDHGIVPEAFRHEVLAMSSVPPHPNILPLLGVCCQPPTYALVTPYLPSGSLHQLLHTPGSGPLGWNDIIRILHCIASGMAWLHRHGVLHRDLKPANILLDNTNCVRIADFGLARLAQQEAAGAMTGGLGTLHWAAPEVLAHQRYSEKADVFSFGIIACECISRQLPYAHLTPMQAAMAVVNSGLRPPIPPQTPQSLAQLIRACWAAVPCQRPSYDTIEAALASMTMWK